MGIHWRQDRWFICKHCRKTFTSPHGTVFYRLRPSADLVVLLVPLLAHGGSVQALVAAFGLEERTVAAWGARAGQQGQAGYPPLGEPPHDRGQRQADAIRVKRPGGSMGRALAMTGKPRVWLAGEVSAHRALPLMRRRSECVRRGALPRPILLCTDSWASYGRAIRATWREPVRTGAPGHPRLRPGRNVCIAQVVQRSAQRRVVDVERRIVAGTPARVEPLRGRAPGAGVLHTASSERLNATVRERLASLTRRGRALARHRLTLQHGMYLMGTL